MKLPSPIKGNLQVPPLSTVQGANLCIRRREQPILLLHLDNLCPHQRRTTTHNLVPVTLFLAMHQGDEGVTGMYRIWQSSTACLSQLGGGLRACV